MEEKESLESEKLNNGIKDDSVLSKTEDSKIAVNRKSTKKNYFYNLIYQLFLIIVPLITTPYISRTLTTSGVGKYSFAFSLITYFTIFGALGFGYYAQREIAKHQNDKVKQTISFWEINICRLIPVSISIIINLVLCLFNVYASYNLLMLIFSINILALAFDEDFGKIVFRNVIIKSFSVGAIFIFVKNTSDIWIYALINSTMVVLSNISLWPYLFKVLVKINPKELRPLRHLKGTIVLFVPTIAVSIYTILDKTLIGVLVPGTYTEIVDGEEVIKKFSDLENGYYEQAEKLVKMTLVVITCIGTVMIPRNSNEIAKGNLEQVKKNIFISSKIVLLIGVPLALGLIVIAKNVIPWFLGEGYEKSIIIMQILAPLILIIGFSNVFGLQFLVPSGKDMKFTLALVAGAVINLLLNIFFIQFWYSIGAAIATIIAECCVTGIMAFMVRKEVSFIKVLLSGWKYYFSGAIMFVSCYFIGEVFTPSILNTVIIAGSGVLIYFTMLLLFRDEIVTSTLKKLLRKIHSTKH